MKCVISQSTIYNNMSYLGGSHHCNWRPWYLWAPPHWVLMWHLARGGVSLSFMQDYAQKCRTRSLYQLGTKCHMPIIGGSGGSKNFFKNFRFWTFSDFKEFFEFFFDPFPPVGGSGVKKFINFFPFSDILRLFWRRKKFWMWTRLSAVVIWPQTALQEASEYPLRR